MSQITIIGASWCAPCKYLKANIEEWAEETQCEIPITYEEYDEEIHHVKKLPTTVYTYDGLEKQRIEGRDKTQMKVFLMNAEAYGEFLRYGDGD